MAHRLSRIVPIVAVVLLAVSATPAQAIGPFGPPVGVYDPPCSFPTRWTTRRRHWR
jgi:hypothetical protein